MQKNIVIGLSEIPKPMAAMSVALPMLDLTPKQFSNVSGHWRKDDMTAKQMSYLKSFGVIVTQKDFQKFTKGDACDVIDALTTRKDQRARLQYHLDQASRLLEASRF
jgi:hypothetical protein